MLPFWGNGQLRWDSNLHEQACPEFRGNAWRIAGCRRAQFRHQSIQPLLKVADHDQQRKEPTEHWVDFQVHVTSLYYQPHRFCLERWALISGLTFISKCHPSSLNLGMMGGSMATFRATCCPTEGSTMACMGRGPVSSSLDNLSSRSICLPRLYRQFLISLKSQAQHETH